ncbi:hypothetical protein KEM56_004116 [Ascosphaera pollenicola]|nr:hypothetical protein KEM56_004116 [Ascosphaera pollenicola]
MQQQQQRRNIPPHPLRTFLTPKPKPTPLTARRAPHLAPGSMDVDSSPDKADTEETPNKPRRYPNITNTGRLIKQRDIFSNYSPAQNGYIGHTPGRGSIPKKARDIAAADRIFKRRRPPGYGHIDPTSVAVARQRSARQETREESGFTDSEDEFLKPEPSAQESSKDTTTASEQAQRESSPQYTWHTHQSIWSRLFTFIETHPTVPGILSYYAQFVFNAFLALLTLYIIVSFLLAIRSEVNRASEELSAEILTEMAACARDYVENRCAENGGGRRLPYLEAVCDKWERCMNRDPAKVGRATLSAKTLAEIFNGFIEPISYKAFFFVTVTGVCSLAVSNFSFTFFRNKIQTYEAQHQIQSHQQQQNLQPPPQPLPAPPPSQQHSQHPAPPYHTGTVPFTPAHQIYDPSSYYGWPPQTQPHSHLTGMNQ